MTATATLKTIVCMSAPAIDLQPLRNDLSVLREALWFWNSHADGQPLKRHLRSAVIQSFEFSYELSVRMLRRTLPERAVSAAPIAAADDPS